MSTPQQIIAEARSWLGVPFLHQGRTREGVDCAGHAIEVGIATGETFVDVNGYDRFRDGTMKPACDANLIATDGPVLGGLLMMCFEKEPQHLAIVANYLYGGLSIIHALGDVGRVCEHRLTPEWRRRIVQAYRYKGMT